VPPKTDPQYSDAELNLRAAVNWTPREPSIREQVLDEAKKIVTSDRNVKYGSPESNFETISELWTTYFHRRGLLRDGACIEPFDTAVAQVLVKVARIGVSPGQRDHWVDMAGYAAGGFEVAKESND
jgi:hypothetical protein